MARRVYLDHNASSPLRPEAREAMLRVMDMPGNPSSVHAEGRTLKGEVERARRSVAKLVGADPQNIYFTSGATEAANWAAGGLWHAGGHAVVGATEHPCVIDALRARGHRLQVGRVQASGREEEASLNPKAKGAPVYLQEANSETGVISRVDEVRMAFGDDAGPIVSDVTQALGRFTYDLSQNEADIVFFSSHKLGGPRGVGALALREPGTVPTPLHRGGGQERRQRAGTENVVGIAGFGAAAEAALRDLDDMPRIQAMRDRLEAGLADLSAKWGVKLHIFGQSAERLPNTSCFAFAGVSAQTALMSLDLDGFAVSSGSACSSGKVGPSHVLAAMGVPDDVALCALRVSLGWSNEEDDIPAFLAAYEKILARSLKRAA